MESLIEEHEAVLGVKPVIIGLFWNDMEQLMNNIEEAIDNGTPYDETKLLTDEQRKAYEKGELDF